MIDPALRDRGAVYTPTHLAEWIAGEVVSLLPADRPSVVLDPACGDGALLAAVAKNKRSLTLVGVDIDADALTGARAALPEDALLYRADALLVGRTLFGTVGADLAPLPPADAVIANPPWGARLAHSRPMLQQAAYRVAVGQFDSFDLFVEQSLNLTKDGGVLAFILPDAVFAPEHAALRTLLLEQTSLLLVARLGEGFFDGVYRGTAVVLCRKGCAGSDHQLDTFRLTADWRRQILGCERTLAEASAALRHKVPQRRFVEDEFSRFDIDARETDQGVLAKIGADPMPWGRWLYSARGVEISKFGEVVFCPQCGWATPAPVFPRLVVCSSCSTEYASHVAKRESITRPMDATEPGWAPLIAGEDVDRYSCAPSRQIKLGVRGINYKPAARLSSRKLLVRKTGVGIKAAIDDSGAYTNQVVFHYVAHENAPPFLLDYVLGVLCSRVLLAYVLKRLGENEWRSHPYITQAVISSLPVPDLTPSSWKWRQAAAIAAAARQRQATKSVELDLEIEGLVAGLCQLDRPECTWVADVLDSAQGLEPIRTLRLPRPVPINPSRI